MKPGWWVIGLGCLVVGASSVWAEGGKAVIRGTSEGSTVSGTATLHPVVEGMALQVSVQVTHVPPGKHGLHIHQYGDCGDSGNGAGGHYNPAGVKHGFYPTDGTAAAHKGDLGNIDVGPDGSGSATVSLPGVSLSEVVGRAIILHEKVDDFGQPTGNAGGRIGCGAVVLTKD